MGVLPTCISMHSCIPDAPQRPEEGFWSHELESQMVVSCLVSAGKQTQFSGRAGLALSALNLVYPSVPEGTSLKVGLHSKTLFHKMNNQKAINNSS